MGLFLCIESWGNKKPPTQREGGLKKAATYSPTNAVPSALLGLTSLFGMGRGEPQCNSHLIGIQTQRWLCLHHVCLLTTRAIRSY